VGASLPLSPLQRFKYLIIVSSILPHLKNVNVFQLSTQLSQQRAFSLHVLQPSVHNFPHRKRTEAIGLSPLEKHDML
jgi:hypothetical protein